MIRAAISLQLRAFRRGARRLRLRFSNGPKPVLRRRRNRIRHAKHPHPSKFQTDRRSSPSHFAAFVLVLAACATTQGPEPDRDLRALASRSLDCSAERLRHRSDGALHTLRGCGGFATFVQACVDDECTWLSAPLRLAAAELACSSDRVLVASQDEALVFVGCGRRVQFQPTCTSELRCSWRRDGLVSETDVRLHEALAFPMNPPPD